MCGIVGYLGPRQAQDVLLTGLSSLEYRGYDSAGIAVINDSVFTVVKAKGKLMNLKEKLSDDPVTGSVGIGHTRWATHGAASDQNSHPHVSMDGKIAVVHNGIIENHRNLREELQSSGIEFQSETDTEVVPNLIAQYLKQEEDLLSAVLRAREDLVGSYALGILSVDEPDKLIALRKDSPLIIGLGDDESFIASDVPAVLKYTKNVVYLDNMELAVLSSGDPKFYDKDGTLIKKQVQEITWTAEAAEKGGYEHFTLKEIHEQPKALKDTLSGRIQPGNPVILDEVNLTREDLLDLTRIVIVACGTAWHAGLVGKYVLETIIRKPVEVDVASEFRYNDPLIDEHTLVIVISQSGETADTLAALKEAQGKGAKIAAITNVVGSSIAREADNVIYTWAGPEIGVASTKAYLTQLVSLYALGIHFAEVMNLETYIDLEELKEGLLTLPQAVEDSLKLQPFIKLFAESVAGKNSAFFLGRGLDQVTAREGSLKLKELSYIHAEAYPGGEMKHGPIALIEEDTVVIAPLTQKALIDKMASNLTELRTRGASVTVITTDVYKGELLDADNIIVVPQTLDILSPITAIIPLQLLAYYVSLAKGYDVDKPRNLAKSVTVE